MFEAVSESWQTHFKLGRKTAVVICSALTIGVGIFMESEERVGAWMDFITIQVVPIGAVLGAISIYYVLGWSKLRKELETGRQKPLSRRWSCGKVCLCALDDLGGHSGICVPRDWLSEEFEEIWKGEV